MKKNPKSTPLKKSSNTNTTSNCYSLTIRTGNGINLGSSTVSSLVNHIYATTKYAVLNIEKKDNEAHIQGALFYETPVRQDKLREKFLIYAIDIYKEQCSDPDLITTTQLENVRKYSVKVKNHNSFDILVKYCMKDLHICYTLNEDPYTLILYKYSKKLWDILEEIYYNQMPKFHLQ